MRSNRRGTDPYARWCGRGGAVRRPPIPIIEPHRTGCYIYAGGHKWDVAHSHAEITQTVNTALRAANR